MAAPLTHTSPFSPRTSALLDDASNPITYSLQLGAIKVSLTVPHYTIARDELPPTTEFEAAFLECLSTLTRIVLNNLILPGAIKEVSTGASGRGAGSVTDKTDKLWKESLALIDQFETGVERCKVLAERQFEAYKAHLSSKTTDDDNPHREQAMWSRALLTITGLSSIFALVDEK